MEPLALGVNRANREHQGAMLIAHAKGYFAEQGFEVSLTVLGGESLPMLVAGELDAMPQTPNLHFFRAWDPERPLHLVADGGSWAEGRGHGFMVARRDLLQSGQLRDYGDLAGRRIALVSGPGESDETLFREALKRGGLTFDDVEVIRIDERPVRMAGFSNGTIDLAQEGTVHGAAHGRDTGTFDVWKRKYELVAGRPGRVMAFSHRFCTERPDAARRCTVAYFRGLRDYYDAFEHGVGTDEAFGVLAAHSSCPREDLRTYLIPERVNPDGQVNVEGLWLNVNDFKEQGLLPPSFDVEPMLDDSFRREALEEMGLYQIPG